MSIRPIVVAMVLAAVAIGVFAFTIEHGEEPSKVLQPPPAASPSATPYAAPDIAPAPVTAKKSDPTPRAPINRYLSGDGSWDAYQSLRRSTNGGDLWVAGRILTDCFMNTRAQSFVQKILAGQPVIVVDPMSDEALEAFRMGKGELAFHREPATADQLAAARELAARCDRFASMTLPEYRAQADDLKGRRQHAGDPMAVAESIRDHRIGDTPEHLRIVLDSRDPAAISAISGVLWDRRRLSVSLPMSPDELDADVQAMQLVYCDLGNDCGKTSTFALNACIVVARECGHDVASQILSREKPGMQQVIGTRRRLILQAITTGDYTLWGL